MYKILILIAIISGVASASGNRKIYHDIDNLMGNTVIEAKRVIKSIPIKYRSVVDKWYSNSVGIEEIFKLASGNSDSWIVNEWMRNAGDGSELYNIYLVLKTEEIKKKVISGNGSSKEYFFMKALSGKDTYVKMEFDNLFNSNQKNVRLVMDDVRAIKDAKMLLDSYNSGFIGYEKLIGKSLRNKYISEAITNDIAANRAKQESRNKLVVFGPKITILEE